jgi:mRNA-degrading endonuclease RelE of RelBE toxin-antitoxin system
VADYEVIFVRSARREIEALPEELGERILARIRPLAETPRPAGAKKLKNGLAVPQQLSFRLIFQFPGE